MTVSTTIAYFVSPAIRSAEFASEKMQILPNEPNNPLKTIQRAEAIRSEIAVRSPQTQAPSVERKRFTLEPQKSLETNNCTQTTGSRQRQPTNPARPPALAGQITVANIDFPNEPNESLKTKEPAFRAVPQPKTNPVPKVLR
jgi:hypothetical protein